MAEQKRRKPAANSRKPKSSAARSNRKPQKADPHMPGVVTVSYTYLDVYKRQKCMWAGFGKTSLAKMVS